VSAQQADNRRRILKLVRKIWIDGYLKHSLVDNLARIELGLEEKPDAVSRPWDLIVQPPDRAPRPLPPGQAMGAIFDELGQALLILGAPGAGKMERTTFQTYGKVMHLFSAGTFHIWDPPADAQA